MKLFARIFSIYILVLSIMPCSDAYNNCKSNTEFTVSATTHNHKTDHNDFCSPFCTCTCCSVSANPKYTSFSIKTSNIVAGKNIVFPKRDFSFPSNYYGNIWQPPKINA